MKAAEDRLGCDDAEALNRPMEWGILVQRAMNPRFTILRAYRPRIRRKCASPNTIRWSRHSRRIVPISLSTYGFCHGDRGAVGLSRMPMAYNRLEDRAIGRVPGPNKITRCTVPRKRLGDVARNPLRGRICRHPERYPLSTRVTQNHQAIEQPERYRRQHEEVDCRDAIDMIG